MFESPNFLVTLVIIFVVIAIVRTARMHRRHSWMTQPRLCRGCGTSHPPYARFCRRCGRELI
jgi:ribosomal protein L40E